MYPLFVLIPDEVAFMECSDARALQYFEQIDVEEMAHRAWDDHGNEYLLVYKDARDGIQPKEIAVRAATSFRAAIAKYMERLENPRFARINRGRSTPERLLAVLERLENGG